MGPHILYAGTITNPTMLLEYKSHTAQPQYVYSARLS